MKTQVGARVLPRRRKPSVMSRVRPFWIMVTLLAVLVASGGAWLANAPWFRLKQLTVDVPLASPVTRAQVRSAAAIAPQSNVWLLNPGAIAQRIEAIPYVDRATVRRGQLPAPFVELGITLRRPSACVAAGGRVVTIDASARVLQAGCVRSVIAHVDAGSGRLPAAGATITGAELGRLLADHKTLLDGGVLLRKVRRDRWGGLEAVAADGVVLRFGDDADLAKKAALVAPVRAGIGSKRVVRTIDLRAPGTPTVEFR